MQRDAKHLMRSEEENLHDKKLRRTLAAEAAAQRKADAAAQKATNKIKEISKMTSHWTAPA
jgi:hypothetical protein